MLTNNKVLCANAKIVVEKDWLTLPLVYYVPSSWHIFSLTLFKEVFQDQCTLLFIKPLPKHEQIEIAFVEDVFLYLVVFRHNRHSMMPLSSCNFWVSVCEITIISLYLKVWPDGSAVSEFPAILIKSDQAQSSLLSDRELFGLPQLYLLRV